MSKRVIIIGAIAAGPKAASRLRRLEPTTEILMVDKNEYISFGACGIPYYISGEINSIDSLRSTAYGVLRTPEYFQQKGITTYNRTQAISIDRKQQIVLLKHLLTNKEYTVSYDKLVLTTGSKPKLPTIKGQHLKHIVTISNTSLDSAQHIQTLCASKKIKHAVIIGGGFIGLEMAVSLAGKWKIKTSIIEVKPQVMPGYVSPDFADMLCHDLTKNNVEIFTSEQVLQFKGKNDSVNYLITDKRKIETDLVIFATGFLPETTLAQEAGLALDPKTGAILVNPYMQTSDPNIYAGGDCVAVPNPITGENSWFTLGSLANRQGRIIGTNLAGGSDTFPGAVGNWCIKLFTLSACGAGLTLEKAKSLGFDAISASIEQADRSQSYPEHSIISLELIVDCSNRRVLGIQGICSASDVVKARIDAIAMLLQYGHPTIDDISNAEMSYAPPFSSAMDPINVVANVADNILSGQLESVTSKTFTTMWNDRKNNTIFFVDTRPTTASKELKEKYPNEWHTIPFEEISSYLSELPKTQPIALICNTGLRAYETMSYLRGKGITNTIDVLGGMYAIKKRGEEL